MQQETISREITSVRDITVDAKLRKTLALNFLVSGVGVAAILAVGAFLLS